MEHAEVVGGQPGRMGAMGPPRGRGFMVVRGLLVALGAVLGIVLITQGAAVIGVILLTMAVLRGVTIVQMRRRRAWRLERRGQFGAGMWQRTP